ncbi:armadillo beta-catenin-like repeat-containing protein [Cystoisospora suis]|uniref:Armadillo beta-catenin-like repeat-containing protein n=1 Tax=Cystoisospora suis TaxID=483139 RepID=A0A2C6KQP7_9APIC|nr:armadillo beta-catenin-like repeat-containing protein [Cystoisospora suis]
MASPRETGTPDQSPEEEEEEMEVEQLTDGKPGICHNGRGEKGRPDANNALRREVLPSPTKISTCHADALYNGKGNCVEHRNSTSNVVSAKPPERRESASHSDGRSGDVNREGLTDLFTMLVSPPGTCFGSVRVTESTCSSECGRGGKPLGAVCSSKPRSHSLDLKEFPRHNRTAGLSRVKDDSEFTPAEEAFVGASRGPGPMENGRFGNGVKDATARGVRETEKESPRAHFEAGAEDMEVKATLSLKKTGALGSTLCHTPLSRQLHSESDANDGINCGGEHDGENERLATEEREEGEIQSRTRLSSRRPGHAPRGSERRRTGLGKGKQIASDPEGRIAARPRHLRFSREARLTESTQGDHDSCFASVEENHLCSRCELSERVKCEEENVLMVPPRRGERASCSDLHPGESISAWTNNSGSAVCCPHKAVQIISRRDGKLCDSDSFLPRLHVSRKGGVERKHDGDASTEHIQKLCTAALPRDRRSPSSSSVRRDADFRGRVVQGSPRDVLRDDSVAVVHPVAQQKPSVSLKQATSRDGCRVTERGDRQQKRTEDNQVGFTGGDCGVGDSTDSPHSGVETQQFPYKGSDKMRRRICGERNDSLSRKRGRKKARRGQRLERTVRDGDGSRDAVRKSLLWRGLLGIVRRVPFEALVPMTCRYLEQTNTSLYLHHIHVRKREQTVVNRLQEIEAHIHDLEESKWACTLGLQLRQASQGAPLFSESDRESCSRESPARRQCQITRERCRVRDSCERRMDVEGGTLVLRRERCSSSSQVSDDPEGEPQFQRRDDEVLQRQGATNPQRGSSSAEDRTARGLEVSSCSGHQQHHLEAGGLPFVSPAVQRGWDEVIELGNRAFEPVGDRGSPLVSPTKPPPADVDDSKKPPSSPQSDLASQETELEEAGPLSQPPGEQAADIESLRRRDVLGSTEERVSIPGSIRQAWCGTGGSSARLERSALQTLFKNTVATLRRSQYRWLAWVESVCRESTQPVLQLTGLAWVYRQRQVAHGLAKPVSAECLFTLLRSLYVHERQLMRHGGVRYPSLHLAVACLANASVRQLARARVAPLLAELLGAEFSAAPSLAFQIHQRQSPFLESRRSGYPVHEVSRPISLLHKSSKQSLAGLLQDGVQTLPVSPLAMTADTSHSSQNYQVPRTDGGRFLVEKQAGHLSKGSLGLLLTCFRGGTPAGGSVCRGTETDSDLTKGCTGKDDSSSFAVEESGASSGRTMSESERICSACSLCEVTLEDCQGGHGPPDPIGSVGRCSEDCVSETQDWVDLASPFASSLYLCTSLEGSPNTPSHIMWSVFGCWSNKQARWRSAAVAAASGACQAASHCVSALFSRLRSKHTDASLSLLWPLVGCSFSLSTPAPAALSRLLTELLEPIWEKRVTCGETPRRRARAKVDHRAQSSFLSGYGVTSSGSPTRKGDDLLSVTITPPEAVGLLQLCRAVLRGFHRAMRTWLSSGRMVSSGSDAYSTSNRASCQAESGAAVQTGFRTRGLSSGREGTGFCDVFDALPRLTLSPQQIDAGAFLYACVAAVIAGRLARCASEATDRLLREEEVSLDRTVVFADTPETMHCTRYRREESYHSGQGIEETRAQPPKSGVNQDARGGEVFPLLAGTSVDSAGPGYVKHTSLDPRIDHGRVGTKSSAESCGAQSCPGSRRSSSQRGDATKSQVHAIEELAVAAHTAAEVALRWATSPRSSGPRSGGDSLCPSLVGRNRSTTENCGCESLDKETMFILGKKYSRESRINLQSNAASSTAASSLHGRQSSSEGGRRRLENIKKSSQTVVGSLDAPRCAGATGQTRIGNWGHVRFTVGDRRGTDAVSLLYDEADFLCAQLNALTHLVLFCARAETRLLTAPFNEPKLPLHGDAHLEAYASASHGARASEKDRIISGDRERQRWDGFEAAHEGRKGTSSGSGGESLRGVLSTEQGSLETGFQKPSCLSPSSNLSFVGRETGKRRVSSWDEISRGAPFTAQTEEPTSERDQSESSFRGACHPLSHFACCEAEHEMEGSPSEVVVLPHRRRSHNIDGEQEETQTMLWAKEVQWGFATEAIMLTALASEVRSRLVKLITEPALGIIRSQRLLFSLSQSRSSHQWFPEALARFSFTSRLFLSAHLLLPPSPTSVSDIFSKMNVSSVNDPIPCRTQELGALSAKGSRSTGFSLESFSTQHHTRQKAAGRLYKSLGFLADLESFLRTPESNLGVVLSSLVEKFYPSPNIRKHWQSILRQGSSFPSLGDPTEMKNESGEIQQALMIRGCSPERFAVQLLRLRSDVRVEVKERALACICRDQASLRRSAGAFVAAAESRTLGTSVRSHDYLDNAESHCVPVRSSDVTLVNDRERDADGEEREHKCSPSGELSGSKQAADEESGSQAGVQAQKRMRNEGQHCEGNAKQGEAAKGITECAPTSGEAAAQPGGSKLYSEDRRGAAVGYSPYCSPTSIKKESGQDTSTRHDRDYRSGSVCEDEQRFQKEGNLEAAHQAVETSTTDARMKPLPSLSTSCSPVSAFLPSTSTTAVGAFSPSDSAGVSLSLRLPSSASCTSGSDRGVAGVAPAECSGGIEQHTASQVCEVPHRHCSPSSMDVKVDCHTSSTLFSRRTSSESSSPCGSNSASSSSSHRSVSSSEETVGSRGSGRPASEQGQPRLAEVLQAAHRERESNEAPKEDTEARLEGQVGIAIRSPARGRDFPEKGGCSIRRKNERTVEKELGAATEATTERRHEAEVKEFRRGLHIRTQPRRETTRCSAAAGHGGEGEVETEPDTLGDVSSCHHSRHRRGVRSGRAVLAAVSQSDQGNSCKDGGPCPKDRALSMVSAPSAATPVHVEGSVQEPVREKRREQERVLPKQEQWRRRSKAETGGRGKLGEDEKPEDLSAEVLCQERRHFMTASNIWERSNTAAAGDVSRRAERGVRLTTKQRGIVVDSWEHKNRCQVTFLGDSSCVSRRRHDQTRLPCPEEQEGVKGNRAKQVPSFSSLRGYVWHVCPRSLPAGANFTISDILALNDSPYGDRRSPSTSTRSSSFGSECFVPVGVDIEGDQREGQESDSHFGSEDRWNSEKGHASVSGKQYHRDTELARKWWRLDGTLLRVFDSRAELLPELVIDMRDVCRVGNDGFDEDDFCSTGATEEQGGTKEEMSAVSEVCRDLGGQRDHTCDGNEDNVVEPRMDGDQLTPRQGCVESQKMRARRQPKVCLPRRYQDSFRADNKNRTASFESAGIKEDVFARTGTVSVPGEKLIEDQSRDEGDEEEDGETLWQALGYAWIDGAADRFGATARWKLTLTFSDCVRSPLQVVCSSRLSQRMWSEGLRSAASLKTGHQVASALTTSHRAPGSSSESARTSDSEAVEKTQRLSLCGSSRVGMSDTVSFPCRSLVYTEHPHLFQSGTTLYFPSGLPDSLVSCCDALSPRVGSHLARLPRSWLGCALHVSPVCDTPEGTTKSCSLTSETGNHQATEAALEAFNEALGIAQIQ